MARLDYTPIVIGVGDIKNRSTSIADAIEPATLMHRAILAAVKDSCFDPSTQHKIQSSIDSIDVVATWTWPYPDLPKLLAEKLNVKHGLKHKQYSEHGGNQPAKLFDDAARRIAKGESKVAVVTGGEALASLSACAAAGKMPPPGWTAPAANVESVFSPTTRSLGDAEQSMSFFTLNPHVDIDLRSSRGMWIAGLGAKHGIGAPIHVYPLYENGFRAHRNQTIEENWRESAELYAQFAAVAEKNEVAWNHGKHVTAEDIGTVTKKNRMICWPYPLLMNAFNTVNLSAACILTSTSYATELGVPQEKWIYPLGGAGTRESYDFWRRGNYHSSPAISRSLDAAIRTSGLTSASDIDLFDFYSCFPIVPKICCAHLGLDILKPEKPITLLGGLTSFGGAGNNYSMHALTAMVRRLRRGGSGEKTGLVLANGGVLTYQHVVCLSSSPRKTPYPRENPLPEVIDEGASPAVAGAEEVVDGKAVVETYTVEFARSGAPEKGFVVGRLVGDSGQGARFVANHGDEKTLSELCSKEREPVGRDGLVRRGDDGRNLFLFHERAGKL